MESRKGNTSRSKKAFNTSALVYCSLEMGAHIKFIRSKISQNSLKVLRGEEVKWDFKSTTDNTRHFMEQSDIFCDKMTVLVETARIRKVTELLIDWKTLNSVEPKSSMSSVDATQRWKDLDYNQDCRNKEACFVNYLSYNLLQFGYSFSINISRIKPSKKTANFFIWSEIYTPDNTVIGVNKTPLLVSFIHHVESLLNRSKTSWIGSDDIAHNFAKNSLVASTEAEDSPQTPSAFKPLTDSHYCVLQNFAFTQTHPFILNTFACY
ncbi:hypothetical protein EIN_118010 [Entamoeba invadens IP1]|uniref:Uncharacterized protein n=1 Tax=Entamoeba invadens IP1 TaxID=370355 RepID=L7FMY5_ENTIV|nr:hypothetical protein EIN_118010 [Entamoeba invadens IP1]ELP92227.1 hypothetical protein EIN_118010 [Entamoeba invadens IP1]|eukprot:XP_004258998.1 hypothetical protein EIN_118010 [Entamoeba invadens IP1]